MPTSPWCCPSTPSYWQMASLGVLLPLAPLLLCECSIKPHVDIWQNTCQVLRRTHRILERCCSSVLFPSPQTPNPMAWLQKGFRASQRVGCYTAQIIISLFYNPLHFCLFWCKVAWSCSSGKCERNLENIAFQLECRLKSVCLLLTWLNWNIRFQGRFFWIQRGNWLTCSEDCEM